MEWYPGKERLHFRVKIDPFAPALLVDYDLCCRTHGYVDFGEYMAHWYTVSALVEATEAEGRDPFELTLNDVEVSRPGTPVN